ncbi:MAG: GH3 auxin-responsive promoter family protein [Dehalococcoidales bacterium]
MLSEDKYFRDLTEPELWMRYCGFLDLSINEFMKIQENLLMDQINLVADSTLGKKIMGERKPTSIAEFRQVVPMTTYEDYEPYLSNKQEDAIAIKPYKWCHSAGRSGNFKWLPISQETFDKSIRDWLASWVLASAIGKGRVMVKPGLRVLASLPPPPYTSGTAVQYIAEHFSYRAIPPPELVKDMEFVERMQKGFQIAMKDGVDILSALTSVLVRMGEGFAEQTRKVKFSPYMLHPKILSRYMKAWIRCKRERRALLPKDLWSPKAIVSGGVDTTIYKSDIAHYWGTEPFDFYVTTETFFLAMQAWNKKAMTFLPDSAFLEFIPVSERVNDEKNKHYKQPTVLLDELQEGHLYEVIITQFHGMPLLRYRLDDIVKVVSIRDKETGVNLPQIMLHGRVSETIDLAGLVELDEKTIWQAIVDTGIKFVDWTARKEYSENKGYLHIYIELKEPKDTSQMATMIDRQLREADIDYRDIDDYLAFQPVKLTPLRKGTFQRYTDEKRREGADLAHLKPIHLNASDAVIEHLLALSEELSSESSL